MSKLWLYGVLARVPIVGYRAKVVAVAAMAAALPFGLWLAGAAPLAWLAAAVWAVLLLAALFHMLRPVSLVARALRACIDGHAPPAMPTHFSDEAGRLMADALQLATKLDGVRNRLSHRHPITALPTREPFLAQMAEDVRRPAKPTMLGVIRFADYDRLAAFDQTAADRALEAFARRLEDAVETSRPLAQVDRDCFAIWFRGVEGAQVAAGELQAVAYVLGQELTDRDLKIAPEVGLGAAIYPHDGEDPAGLLTRALAALPKAGQPGSGKVTFFSAQSAAAARERFSVEQGLRQAIGREQLSLCYQPVVDLALGRVIGAEALLRWSHPELGSVPPSEFIPILEESGLMEEVGVWVLNTACREARAWEDQGLGGLKMAVNLSARQLHDPGLDAIIVRTLERHRLAPQRLELELTETATMQDAARTRQLFGDLLAMGVSVAIDDFGAGYSSLSYLKNLPFSKLKIDREFVEGVDGRPDSQAICRALVELCRGLGIAVLAEGVETREEVETLCELGCSIFQGFYFAKPLPAAEFVRTVTDPAWLAQLSTPALRRLDAPKRRVKQ